MSSRQRRSFSARKPSVSREFADYCGVAHCVGVGNGTDAIELALRANGIGAGDEVILPANTFVATAEAVVRAGATPMLVDCDEDFLVDVERVGHRHITHAGDDPGSPVRPTRAHEGTVRRITQRCPCHRRRRPGAGCRACRPACRLLRGRCGDQLLPGKNLGAYGDAGAVLTDDGEMAERLRRLRSHGGVRKYEHRDVGVNSRLDGLQAVVLSAKLAVLDAWNAERRAAAVLYDELLADLPEVVRPRTRPGNEHVWHLYVAGSAPKPGVGRTQRGGDRRGVHYPAPVHLLPAFEDLGYRRGDFPLSEGLADEILSLPIYPGITAEQQMRVVEVLPTVRR